MRLEIQLLFFLCIQSWNLQQRHTPDLKKTWSSLPHQHSINAIHQQGCWLQSISSDFFHNEHVITSWFQLEQDTDLGSCMFKCLHLRIPCRYQMRRRLRQTWLALWLNAAGHGFKVSWESIWCAYQREKSQDLMIWEFWLNIVGYNVGILTSCSGWKACSKHK